MRTECRDLANPNLRRENETNNATHGRHVLHAAAYKLQPVVLIACCLRQEVPLQFQLLTRALLSYSTYINREA